MELSEDKYINQWNRIERLEKNPKYPLLKRGSERSHKELIVLSINCGGAETPISKCQRIRLDPYPTFGVKIVKMYQ